MKDDAAEDGKFNSEEAEITPMESMNPIPSLFEGTMARASVLAIDDEEDVGEETNEEPQEKEEEEKQEEKEEEEKEEEEMEEKEEKEEMEGMEGMEEAKSRHFDSSNPKVFPISFGQSSGAVSVSNAYVNEKQSSAVSQSIAQGSTITANQMQPPMVQMPLVIPLAMYG